MSKVIDAIATFARPIVQPAIDRAAIRYTAYTLELHFEQMSRDQAAKAATNPAAASHAKLLAEACNAAAEMLSPAWSASPMGGLNSALGLTRSTLISDFGALDAAFGGHGRGNIIRDRVKDLVGVAMDAANDMPLRRPVPNPDNLLRLETLK